MRCLQVACWNVIIMVYCTFRHSTLSSALFLLTAALSPSASAFLDHQVASDRKWKQLVTYYQTKCPQLLMYCMYQILYSNTMSLKLAVDYYFPPLIWSLFFIFEHLHYYSFYTNTMQHPSLLCSQYCVWQQANSCALTVKQTNGYE